MSSNLKVNTILPSTGTTIGIGTVGGLINVVGNIDVNSTSGISTFNGLEISGIVTAKAGAAVTYYGDGSNLTGIAGGVTSDGSQNTVGGSNAGDSIVSGGTENTVFGYNAGTAISTGDNNTFFGSRSGRSFSTTVNNTGVGYNVLGNASGTGNAAVGRDAGNGMGDGINHCAIGFAAFANTNQIGTQQNNIVIGYLADVSGSTVSNEITLGNANITKFRIPGLNFYNDAGRLLIGTTTEGHASADDLTINNSGNGGITIRTGTSSNGAIFFSDATSGDAEFDGFVQYNHGSSPYMLFGTSGDERLRIDSSGRVGIKNTNMSSFNTGMDDLVIGNGASNTSPGMTIFSHATDIGTISFRDSADTGISGLIQYRHNESPPYMRFMVEGTQRMSITTHGGIAFNSDTAAANTLDDYEEGDYTAHFNVEGQSNISMSNRVGKYVKIGKLVTVIGGGAISSVSGQSSSHAIQFSNLPFAAANTAVGSVGYPFIVKLVGMSNSGIGNMNGNEPYQFIGRLDNNATSGRIEAIRNGSNQDPQNASLALTTNTQIQYMFTYIAA